MSPAKAQKTQDQKLAVVSKKTSSEVSREWMARRGVVDTKWSYSAKRFYEKLMEMADDDERVPLYIRVLACLHLHAFGWLPSSAGLASKSTVAHPERTKVCDELGAMLCLTKRRGKIVPLTTNDIASELNMYAQAAVKRRNPKVSDDEAEAATRKVSVEDIRSEVAGVEETGWCLRTDSRDVPLSEHRKTDAGRKHLRTLAHGKTRIYYYLVPRDFTPPTEGVKSTQLVESTDPANRDLWLLRVELKRLAEAGQDVSNLTAEKAAALPAIREILDAHEHDRAEINGIKKRMAERRGQLASTLIEASGQIRLFPHGEMDLKFRGKPLVEVSSTQRPAPPATAPEPQVGRQKDSSEFAAVNGGAISKQDALPVPSSAPPMAEPLSHCSSPSNGKGQPGEDTRSRKGGKEGAATSVAAVQQAQPHVARGAEDRTTTQGKRASLCASTAEEKVSTGTKNGHQAAWKQDRTFAEFAADYHALAPGKFTDKDFTRAYDHWQKLNPGEREKRMAAFRAQGEVWATRSEDERMQYLPRPLRFLEEDWERRLVRQTNGKAKKLADKLNFALAEANFFSRGNGGSS